MPEQAKAGGYAYDEDTRTLTINLLGSPQGASIEDFESVMSKVIDNILSVKKVLSIVLTKEREYEYTGDQVRMLVEIADIVEEIVRTKVISFNNIRPDKWGKCYPDFSQRMQYILIKLLRRDPIGAYVEMRRESRNLAVKIKRGGKCLPCYSHYKGEIIDPILKKMENTKMMQLVKARLSGYHVGDRSLYREIFNPSVRPNFMLTRYMITPPERGKSVDRYKVNDTQVEIYRIPTSSSYFYHITPPEFALPEDKYTILDTARRYMATHKPKTAEFVRSEKVREVFYNIGKDMIREVADKSGVYLKTQELNQLAEILTRYTAGLGVLEVLLADEKIQDIYVNSPVETSPVLISHGDYEECETNIIPTKEDAESWATRLRIQSGRPLDEANPVLDTDIMVPGGKARFAVITKNLSPEGFGFAIRRHRDKPWTLPLFIRYGMIDPLGAGLLSFLIDGSVSMLVAGGRGAGKTSLLGSLMLELLPKTRMVTIEDSVTGDCEFVYERNGAVRRGKIGDVIDEMIKKYGKKAGEREFADKNPEDIKVFSIDRNGKAVLSKVSRFIRHKVRKEIYEIETRTGRKIRVTGDHSLFTMGETGCIEAVECRKLRKDDHIVTPRILPIKPKGMKSVNLLDHMDKMKDAYITGPVVSQFIEDNKHTVSKTAKRMGYFVEGPLKGTTQSWKRNAVIPVCVLEKITKKGGSLKGYGLKMKFKTSSIPIRTKIPLNKELLEFFGLWIADGCYDRNSVIISVNEEEAREVVRKVGILFELEPRMHSDGFSLMLNSKALKRVMKDVFDLKGNAFSKRIPEWAFNLPKRKMGYLLKGLFSGDGCVSDKEIMISLRSQGLIRDIQTLLLGFGIIGRCGERAGFYHCRISALNSLKLFKRHVSLLQNKKMTRLGTLCSKISTHDSSDVIPFPTQVKQNIALGYPALNTQDYITRGNNIGRSQLGRIAGYMDQEDIGLYDNVNNLASSDILWDQIKSIEVIGNDPVCVYDFSVPGTENFVCENILAHNTLELPVAQLRDLNYNIESLKSRSVITRVESEMPADEALRTALRLGDSALILGEVRSSIRGNEEVVVVDNGVMKRVRIRDLENKDLTNVHVPTVGFDLKVRLSELTGFVKHPKRKKLLRIKTKTGREITVTHDHSLFAPTKNFEIAPTECKNLKIGDQIVIPSYMPYGFNDVGHINVFDYLPEFRVQKFENDVRKAIKNMGWKRATEICDIKCGDVYNYFRENQKTNIPFNSFSNLMNAANVDYDFGSLEVRKGTSLPIPASIPVNEDLCRFLGYYVSEGYYSLKERCGGSVIITNSNPEIKKDISEVSRKLFRLSPRIRNVKGIGKSVQHQFHCIPLAKLISRLGCGRICTEKRVPPLIFGLSQRKIAAFLRALYSGDGSFTSSESSGNCIRYFSTSKKLVEDVSYLLLNFGIVGSIRKRKPHGRGKNALWILEFKDREMVGTFMEEIGFVGKKTEIMIKKWAHTRSNFVSFDKKTLKEHLTEYPRRYRHLFRFLRCSRNYLKKVVLDPDCEASEKLRTFALGDFFLDEIKEIEEITPDKAEHVYDLSVESTENFIGGFGGILLHNTEAKALYEAMRIGALSNVVSGTIHGESAYGVYDRVVNDLGVPSTSFKATDIIPVCKSLRSADGLHRYRRVTEITEVRKHWEDNPAKEGGFVNLMEYSGKEDKLKPTDTFKNGESEVINRIASYVKEWSGNWEAVWNDINLRAKMKDTMVKMAKKLGKDDILESEWVVASNIKHHLIAENIRNEVGSPDSKDVYEKWLKWLKAAAKAKKL